MNIKSHHLNTLLFLSVQCEAALARTSRRLLYERERGRADGARGHDLQDRGGRSQHHDQMERGRAVEHARDHERGRSQYRARSSRVPSPDPSLRSRGTCIVVLLAG